MYIESSKFPYQNFALKNFGIAYFTNLTRFVMIRMSKHAILKYFHPILDKKDPPEDKELFAPSGLLSKVIPSSSIASCG